MKEILMSNYDYYISIAKQITDLSDELKKIGMDYEDEKKELIREKKRINMERIKINYLLNDNDLNNDTAISGLLEQYANDEKKHISELNDLYNYVRNKFFNTPRYSNLFVHKKQLIQDYKKYPQKQLISSFLELKKFSEKVCDQDLYTEKLKRKELQGYYNEENMIIDFFRGIYQIKDSLEQEYNIKKRDIIRERISELSEKKEKLDSKICIIEDDIYQLESQKKKRKEEKIDSVKINLEKIHFVLSNDIETLENFNKTSNNPNKSFFKCISSLNRLEDDDVQNYCDELLSVIPQFKKNGYIYKISFDLAFSLKTWMAINIDYDEFIDKKLAKTVQTLICQICGGTDEFSEISQIYYVDLLEKAADLGVVISLDGMPSYHPKLQVVKDSESFLQLLNNLEMAIESTTKRIAGFEDVFTFNSEQNKGNELPYLILILNNFGVGYENTHWQKLSLLVESAKRCGIHLLFLKNESKSSITDNSVQGWINNNMLNILAKDDSINIIDDSETTRMTELEFVETKQFNEIYQYLYDELSSMIIDNDILNHVEQNVDSSAISSIRIPFAIDDRASLITLDLGSSLAPHALISGTSGSGKSTALHTIIQGIASKYTSDEVELWLVDYKINEFAQYINETLPHIKLIGLQKDKSFTFGLLDEIEKEQKRRTELFLNENVTDFESYRALPASTLPRILIIIDEFHILSQHISSDYEYKQKLENLLSELRSVGLSFLFSDQSLQEGLRGFTEKGRQQVMTRLAMKNTPNEIRETLMLTNLDDTPVSLLRDLNQGEVIVRQNIKINGTEKKLMQRGKVLFANDSAKKRIAQKAKIKCENCLKKNVKIIQSNKRQTFDENVINEYKIKNPEIANSIPVYLGIPTSFKECFRMNLIKGPYQNILVVSNNDSLKKSLLFYTAYCFLNKGLNVTILADKYDLFYNECRHLFDNLELNIITNYSDICKFIKKELSTLDDSCNSKLYVWLGLEAMFEEFDMMSEEKNDFNLDSIFGSENFTNKNDLLMGRENNTDNQEGYNATSDLLKLFFRSSKKNAYSWVCFDSLDTMEGIRRFKKEYFKNIFISKMNASDARFILGYTYEIEDMNDDSILFSSSKGDQEVFIPYLLQDDENMVIK